jgi:thioredoxin reductase
MTECIVIGGGLAGLSAALTLAQHRAGVELIATSTTETRAGKLALTTYYPGGSAAASGASLVEHITSQLRETHCTLTTDTVQQLATADSGFQLTLASGTTRQCRTVIAATGIGHVGHTVIPGEDAFFGKGVMYQMQVDGPLYAGKTLVATGKTSAIVEELVGCARWFERVYFVVPATKLEIAEDLLQRLQKCGNVEIVYSASLKEIQGLAAIGSVMIQAAGQDRQLHAQAVWIPSHTHCGNASYLNGIAQLAETQTPLVSPQLATSCPGLFACGDMICGEYQHPSIAAAQGVAAAFEVLRQL